MRSASSSEEPSNSAPPIPSIEDEFPITTAQGNLLYLFNTNSFGDPSQFEYLNGFHLNDPNWLTVLDNIPYYLDPLVDGSKEQIADYKQYGPVTETTNGNIDTLLSQLELLLWKICQQMGHQVPILLTILQLLMVVEWIIQQRYLILLIL